MLFQADKYWKIYGYNIKCNGGEPIKYKTISIIFNEKCNEKYNRKCLILTEMK